MYRKLSDTIMAKKSDQAALNIHSIPVVCFSHQHVLGKSFFPYLWSLLISCWKNSTLFLLAVVLYVKSVYHIFFFKFINLWNSSTTSSRTWCIISDIECMYLQGSFQNTLDNTNLLSLFPKLSRSSKLRSFCCETELTENLLQFFPAFSYNL